MANYTGIYYSDTGLIIRLAKLQVYSVVNGSRVDTTREFGNDYLPNVYKLSVQEVDNRFLGCSFDYGRVRYTKLFYNSTDFLHVDLPFRPGTTEYNQFFIDVAFNTRIVTIGLVGELFSTDLMLRRYYAS